MTQDAIDKMNEVLDEDFKDIEAHTGHPMDENLKESYRHIYKRGYIQCEIDLIDVKIDRLVETANSLSE